MAGPGLRSVGKVLRGKIKRQGVEGGEEEEGGKVGSESSSS